MHDETPTDAAPTDAALTDAALDAARSALARARDRLDAAGARDELLATWVTRRFRSGTFVTVGRGWRLGVLLLGRDGALYAGGPSMRIDTLRHDNHQSNLAAERRALRAAALAAGVPAGETLAYDADPITLDDGLTASPGPLVLSPDAVLVRWNPHATNLVPLGPYLDDRVGLLIGS